MSWCSVNYHNDREAFLKEQNIYDYFDLREQFSSWDRSHKKTEAFIKQHMHDPKSYDHVKTSYIIQKEDPQPHMIVSTTYRGSNAFGAVVMSDLKVKVDLKTGEVLGVVE